MKLKNDGELDHNAPKSALSKAQQEIRLGKILIVLGWTFCAPALYIFDAERGLKGWLLTTAVLVIIIGFLLWANPTEVSS